MSDAPQRFPAIEAFLGALVKGAKTVSLYKEGHPLIQQVVGRVNGVLKAAVGQDPNLTLDIKAKSVLIEESPLAETPETAFFASSLHLLGVGQILFSARLSDEGLLQFMRLLVAKPESGKTLTDLQKAVQDVRIDGLQMSFILSFVVTGEQQEDARQAGQLTEEQIQAFMRAPTLPDLLLLLYKQNEPLTNKEAESITALLGSVLGQEIPREEFQEKMPWSRYDPRIRACWDRLLGEAQAADGGRRETLVSELSLLSSADAASMRSPRVHEAAAAFQYSLDQLHALIANPAGDRQPKFAALAYMRLLADLARRGDAGRLFAESELWQRLEADPLWSAHMLTLKKDIQERLPTPAVAEGVGARIASVVPQSEEFKRMLGFCAALGPKMAPGLLECLRKAPDRSAREKLCSFLAALSRSTGPDALIAGLADEDYFMVVNIIGILTEMGLPDLVNHLGPLLRHRHPKVRAAAVRGLGRSGGACAAEALAAFILAGIHPEEERLAVTTLSLLTEPGVDAMLIAAFERNKDYETRVGIVTALGRLPGPRTKEFLEAVARQSWYEWLTGLNKSLRLAARASLKQISREPDHGAPR
ncbi:MAG: HEAT repeat domain-containing protein [Elusimicrobiota bacterium]